MNFHAFIEYLKYRFKAKGRHGTHSPFVYAFVDQVLMDKSPVPFKEKLEAYFSDCSISYSKDAGHVLPVKNSRVIILVEGIRQSPEHTIAWEKLCNDASVKMSIDMYTYGMLLSLDEFKEKQHFVLKYPG